MAINIEHVFDYPASLVWSVVGQPDRVDWVPGVEGCDYADDVRSLNMPGAGAIKERILLKDDEAYRLEYSCIESPMPLKSHLASIQLVEQRDQCRFICQTNVEPVAVETYIIDSMKGALIQLEQVLAKEK